MGARDVPLLELKGIARHYVSGDSVIRALDGVDVTLHAGEFVAIMGQSGSGKSTLMNIIGCLDKQTAGSYRVWGRDVAALDGDDLARLRRETFGFIFQRYNLLPTASAAENVEIPAIYAGMAKEGRVKRALALLGRLGLGERAGHRPSELSGGQQQRVAIARALVNNPPVILADEPTGALDSKSGREVMELLQQLHAEGRTVVLITHDEQVAAHAKRIIRVADGRVIADDGDRSGRAEGLKSSVSEGGEGVAPEVGEAIKMALRSLRVNLFRTSLTLLGIIIGVASVVTMMAVGNGSKQNVVSQISAMGTNLLSIRPGAPGMRPTGDIVTLVPADVEALRQVPNVEGVSAERSGRYTVRFGRTDYMTSVNAVGAAFPAVREWAVEKGNFFTERDEKSYAPVAVLGKTVVASLFGDENAEVVGEKILVRNVPYEVIGVMSKKGAAMMGNDQDDVIFIPVTTGLVRLFGKTYVNNISVKVTDVAKIEETQEEMRQLLMERHRTEDFSIRNMSSLLEMATSTQNTLTILLGTVAAISLLVGGIGVMNIMLVSVTERTREIGVRMATGARRRDILLQFITEAGVVCTIGGVLGVVLGVTLALVLMVFEVNILLTFAPAMLAFGCAFATGIVFGYIPARKAAAMDPVMALATE